MEDRNTWREATHHIVIDERTGYDLLECNKDGVAWRESCLVVRNGLSALTVVTAKLIDGGLDGGMKDVRERKKER